MYDEVLKAYVVLEEYFHQIHCLYHKVFEFQRLVSNIHISYNSS
jgi:hypothetical protein